MLQEVITYMIIGGAVTLAIIKTVNRFNKKKTESIDYKQTKIASEHNCSECAAECMLRNAPKKIIEVSQTAACKTEKAR